MLSPRLQFGLRSCRRPDRTQPAEAFARARPWGDYLHDMADHLVGDRDGKV